MFGRCATAVLLNKNVKRKVLIMFTYGLYSMCKKGDRGLKTKCSRAQTRAYSNTLDPHISFLSPLFPTYTWLRRRSAFARSNVQPNYKEATMLRLTTIVLAVSLAVPLAAAAQEQVKQSGDMTIVRAELLTWAPLDRPGFRPGISIAVLAGDPSKEGPYTLRLQLPAGYRFPAHTHPNTENLTVISGKFLVGMGDKTDIRKLSAYEPGDYLNIP